MNRQPATDPETELFKCLIELQHGLKVEDKLRRITQEIPWAKGWPDDKKAFWNAEAFMWRRKVEKEKRRLIEKELLFLRGGENLDLGCGAYSYLPSLGLDLSEKMLQLNGCCRKKLIGDLEEKLPFPGGQFDSVTAVFVLNYVRNYRQLLLEIKRILKSKGIFAMVLSSKKINQWQGQKEVSHFSARQWRKRLEESGFSVVLDEKEGLWFFRCRRSRPDRD